MADSEALAPTSGGAVQRQVILPLSKAFEISLNAVRNKFGRSLVTGGGIVFAITFLMATYTRDQALDSIKLALPPKLAAVRGELVLARELQAKLAAVAAPEQLLVQTADAMERGDLLAAQQAFNQALAARSDFAGNEKARAARDGFPGVLAYAQKEFAEARNLNRLLAAEAGKEPAFEPALDALAAADFARAGKLLAATVRANPALRSNPTVRQAQRALPDLPGALYGASAAAEDLRVNTTQLAGRGKQFNSANEALRNSEFTRANEIISGLLDEPNAGSELQALKPTMDAVLEIATRFEMLEKLRLDLIKSGESLANAEDMEGTARAKEQSESKARTVWLIGLALLVAFVGIMNAMLMSVTERFREIGTMKCLGALDGFIVKLFLIESSLQGLVGTVLGVVLGLAIALWKLHSDFGGQVWSFLDWGALGVGMLLALLVGTVLAFVGAIVPAVIAARMEPVVAMRVDQ
ncbi:MAG: FtsX-like permease family protein [Planctomycetes bacterium]|nr:FtsX-like permease family protein [Planctomycetota bacterium]